MTFSDIWGCRKRSIRDLHLLKKHPPYHESDHIMNLAYKALLDGVRLGRFSVFRISAVYF
jgi:hypothetical protein